ncbi:MAG: prepilin-type N-terminal cleavage/methylation domain-containing protein [Candidatus Margulisiibacteriota bacterium]
MNRKGVTLIEMIMAIVIVGIIASIFAVVLNSGMGAWFFIKGQKGMMMETRAVMKRMLREIRMTKSNDSSDILNFESTRYRFIDVNNNTIDYQQSGTNLTRNSVVLLSNLANPGGLQFSYHNSSGAETTSTAFIRTVKITLYTQSGSNVVRLQSAASIRNR